MKKLLALCLVSLLAACASEPAIEPINLDFSSFGKTYLNTSDLRIIDRSKTTPQSKPYVGHLFSPTLSHSVNRLAAERFQAEGKLGHATFIIKDANVTEQPLETTSDMSSLFTRQQASKYIGRIEVSLETQSPADGGVGMASASAVHTVTLPEDPSAAEKQEAYRMLLTSLMTTLNKNLDSAVNTHLSRFLLSSPAAANEAPLAAPTTDSAMPRTMEIR